MMSPPARIALGSVYTPPAVPYPRLLVTRRWPRGVERGAVDQWEPDLAPSGQLLRAYRHGEIGWDTFAVCYREEIETRPMLVDWAARMATGTGVVLLCSARTDEPCHRTVLAEVLREHLAAPPHSS